MMVSCVIPCFGSENSIRLVVENLKTVFKERNHEDYEVILVNDCSPDNVLGVIRELCKDDNRVKALDLSRNFGQPNAVKAGVQHTCGDIIVFFDDDGQTSPNELWKLVDALDNKYDVVFGKYETKHHALWRVLGSRLNDRVSEILIGKPKELSVTSYYACKRFVADELCRYDGAYPYIFGLFLRATCRIGNVPVVHKERITGRSGYTMKKLIALWLNGFTTFSVKPLRIATFIGLGTAMLGFVYGVYVVLQRFLIGTTITMGWSSIMAALLFIGGVIMIILGIIGEYVGRIYMKVNNSPQYVIRERIGFGDNFDT